MSNPLPTGYPSASAEALAFISARSRLSVADLQVMSLIEAAGESFYRHLAGVVPNEEARQLLEHNAAEERHHAERLLKAVELLGGGSTAVAENAENPYVKPVRPPEHMLTSAAFFTSLVTAEDDSVGNYERWASHEANGEVATLLRLNGREEGLHARRLARVRELLS